MNENFNEKLKRRLKEFKDGAIDESGILDFIKAHEFEDVDFAKIDHKRSIFKNFPEVIFGAGKTEFQTVEIFKKMAARGGNVMATRVSEMVYKQVKAFFDGAVYDGGASLLYLKQGEQAQPYGNVAVLTAGTADIRVAEEAAITAELAGSRVTRVYDVGVAGIKRLFNNIDKIFNANAIIVAAGMEGALCSVAAGIAAAPVIALPTSVGYGASFNGLAALLAMLNSCSPGVAVVNIDNGFGAGYLASQINFQSKRNFSSMTINY